MIEVDQSAPARKLKFYQLVVFDQVLQSGSLVRAAQALNLTQPAVTKIIHELESYFEAPLPVRSNRGVSATELGQVVVQRAKSLLAELRALTDEVNAFQEGTYFAKNFERFIKKVNDEGKGVVQINYIGGPKAIPTFDQGAALRNNVVDLANTSASFTASLVPEGLALNYTNQTMAELRDLGIFATRQLGKRQLTWLRSMPQRRVIACDAPDALAQVLNTVEQLLGAPE